MSILNIASILAVSVFASGSCYIDSNEADSVSLIRGKIEHYHIALWCEENPTIILCGGALISPQHVLTAASCVIGILRPCKLTATPIEIFDEPNVPVDQIYPHPEYFKSGHNIAVLKLLNPMSKTNEMRPIQLTREAPKNFDEVEGVGFSYYNFTSDNDRKFPYESQEYNAQLFNNKVCAAIMDNPVQIPPSNICTHPSVVSEIEAGGLLVNEKRDIMDGIYDSTIMGVNLFTSVFYHLDFIDRCLML